MFISMIAINSFAQNDVNIQNDKTNSLNGLELYLSTNNSKIENSSLSFGLGANIVLFSQKPFNFVVNIFDFNNLVYYYRSERSNLGMLSIVSPNVRYNIGKRTKLFLELGLCYNMYLYDTYVYPPNNRIYDKYVYDNNFGLNAGIGLKIPIKERNIFIKTDCKWVYERHNGGDSDIFLLYYRIVLGFAF